MPNIPYAIASKYFGCSLLATSIKLWSQPQCIWETWRDRACGGTSQLLKDGAEPMSSSCDKRKGPEWWWSTRGHPHTCVAAPKERWWPVLLGCSDTRQDRVTSHDSCGKVRPWPCFSLCCLPSSLALHKWGCLYLSSKLRPSGIFGWQKKDV